MAAPEHEDKSLYIHLFEHRSSSMAGQVDEIKEQMVLKSISQANLLFPVAEAEVEVLETTVLAPVEPVLVEEEEGAEVTTEVAPVLATLVDEERADVLEPTVEVLVDVLAWLVEEAEVVEAAVSLVETTLVEEEGAEVLEPTVEVLESVKKSKQVLLLGSQSHMVTPAAYNVALLHPLSSNAPVPMVVTPSGIRIETRLLHP